MPDTRETLLTPIPVERITFDPARDGLPCVRDTGILVSDVSFELGPEHFSDEEVLRRHPELERADLHAVRTYSDAQPGQARCGNVWRRASRVAVVTSTGAVRGHTLRRWVVR